MSWAEKLVEKFNNGQGKVSVIGMGYVGYPMAQLVASQGFEVTGVDLDATKVEAINSGVSYIRDVPSSDVKPLVESGKLRGTTDSESVSGADVILICVPTPLNKTGDPDMSYVVSALESIKPFLHKGMLIALESTTYPGTTDELFIPNVEAAGFKVGEDIFLAFSPERVDPGNPVFGTKNTPKVVGGVTESCSDVAMAFYAAIIDKPIRVSSTAAAEMVKLYENTFRAINIGLVNELAIICDLLDVDVWEIVNAAGTKPFGFMKFYPGPGLGGHCIPVDPSYLSWKMRGLEYKTRFIELATEINTGMPVWTVNRAIHLLNEASKPVKNSKILILGLAYKADIDDLRESPALDVLRLLAMRGGLMSYHDSHCESAVIDGEVVSSVDFTAEMLAEQDLVIITTGHKGVDYKLLLDNASLVFDTRNITREKDMGDTKAEVVYL